MADAIISARGNILASVTKMQTWAKKITVETTIEAIEVRILKLDEHCKDFKNLENNLYSFPDQVSRYDEFEEKYFFIREVLMRELRTKKNASNATVSENVPAIHPTISELFDQQRTFFENLNTTTTHFADRTVLMSHDHVKLPKIEIAKFDGVYKNWPAFEDSFVSSIHNSQSLSDVNKLKLLKSLLTEGPASLIKNLTETEANYKEAWMKLKTRYDKKRKILTSYITTFLDLSSAVSGKASDIRLLSDKCDELVIGIRTMGSEAEYRDAWLIQIILRKLDSETKQLWSKETTDKEFPTLSDFFKFLNDRCDGLDDGETDDRGLRNRPSSNPTQFSKGKPFFTAMTLNSNSTMCPCCNGNHHLYRCMKFRGYDVKLRRNLVNQSGACYNCLRMNHLVQECPDLSNCRTCNKRHNSLLHGPDSINPQGQFKYPQQQESFKNYYSPNYFKQIDQPHLSTHSRTLLQGDNPPQSQTSTSAPITHQKDPTLSITSNVNDEPNQVMNQSHEIVPQHIQNFATITTSSFFTNKSRLVLNPRLAILPSALIHIRDSNGNIQFANALLDSGSQCTFISEKLVQRLRLARSYSSSIAVNGLANIQAATTRGLVCINVSSRMTSSISLNFSAYILPRLLTLHPVVQDDLLGKQFQSLELADPNTGITREIDILFGADLFFDLMRPEKIVVSGHTLAQSTIFGWIILAPQFQNHCSAASFPAIATIDDVNRTLQRFWELEESPGISELKPDEQACETYFTQSVQRNAAGRYIVRLPFAKTHHKLGHSRSAAVRRLLTMERRFEKDIQLAMEYKKFMNEYLTLGHMMQVPNNEISRKDEEVFYLPHHAVLKLDSSTTKLRVVFDGSCKSSSGLSINDMLLIGPTIQDDLITIMSRFRQHRIVFSADVQKMYRQVLVPSPDNEFQRIVWRNDPTEEIKTYRLNTVTYGMSCAPFLAVRTLQKIANDNEQNHPIIAKIIKRDFYIDDLLSGCENPNVAIKLFEELYHVMEGAGFLLRKWKSNSPDFLSGIPDELKEPAMVTFDDDTTSIKTLGVQWNPVRDVFSFLINISPSMSCSKRNLLSEISKIFDPLGWVSPSTISMKILFQKLWIRNIGWDDEVPADISQQWVSIKLNLPKLEAIEIPRHFFISSTTTSIQIHAFCDASEVAYAAAVYLRTEDTEGTIKTSLIIAKTRVAPLKQVSIPRLELCGAVVLMKLIKFSTRIFQDYQFQVFAWTDSQIVLAWLSDHPRRWNTFIGNRTSQIMEIVPRNRWNYVQSKENPADIASRGITPELLPNFDLWWFGPKWLLSKEKIWPSNHNPQFETMCEGRRITSVVTHIQLQSNEIVSFLLNKFSSFSKVKRIVAKLFKFLYKKLHFIDLIRKAELFIIKEVQRETFYVDIQALKKKELINRKSQLLSLSPFIDNDEILRVGGRLTNLDCEYDIKHPIILPKDHRLTWMIIYETHIFNLHPGPSLLSSLLKQRFWIINGRNAVRHFCQKCVKCVRQKQNITTQLMADLPKQRLTACRPFTTTGVDYAGPIYIKTKYGRGKIPLTKAYIALFICFVTKAVHIELVSDMTTEAFIAALRRFISRRGIPVEIVSDNGTNFIGAKRELQELHEQFLNQKTNKLISDFFSQTMIKFSFNPASAPHFGGLWESNIKSIKYHLNRVTSDTTMTFEEVATLLCQIEALLNSRPLCPLSTDSDDLLVLTPGHFLIGGPPTCLPEPNLQTIPMSRLNRWQNIQQRVQGFWRKWSLEYLHTLQQRPKWRQQSSNLVIGDVVLVKEENLPPARWLLGVIVRLHPGSDGLVRVVTIKTTKGEMKRPIVKLCRLPINTEDTTDI